MRTLKSWKNIKCLTCIAYDICRPGECSKPYGCSQWVGYGDDGNLYHAPDLPTVEKDDDGKITVTLPMGPGRFMPDPPLHVEAGDEVVIQRRMDPEPGGDIEIEPEDHSDDICDCGDPDCSRPMGHPTEPGGEHEEIK